MKKERYLKQSKISGVSKIFLNNASGEAIQHPLNGAIITGYEQDKTEEVKTHGVTTEELVFINSMRVVINNERNQKCNKEDDLETMMLTGANINEDMIIDVKRKGVTQERLYLKTRVQTLSPEDIEYERERVKNIEASQEAANDGHLLQEDKGDHFFGMDLSEGNDLTGVSQYPVTEEEAFSNGYISPIDRVIETKEQAVLFIQESLGVFNDNDISHLLKDVRGKRVYEASHAVVRYVRAQGDAFTRTKAVEAYKKQLRDFLGIKEPIEVDYER